MSNDDHLHSIIADYGDACAEMQAELDRAEARIVELENKNSYNLQIVREATARVAELEHKFAPMREALELVLKYEYKWLVPSSLADVVRAALAPSPKG